MPIPDWLALRGLGSSRLAQISYVFPLVGYVLVFNRFVVDFIAQALNLETSAQATWLWHLYFVYFGLLFFSLASILFAMFCPSVVRQYAGEAEFIERTEVTFSSSDLLHFSNLAAASPTHLGNKARGVPTVVATSGVGSVDRDLVLELRKNFFTSEVEKVPFARAATGLLYLLGGIALAVPTYAGVHSVIAAIVAQLQSG